MKIIHKKYFINIPAYYYQTSHWWLRILTSPALKQICFLKIPAGGVLFNVLIIMIIIIIDIRNSNSGMSQNKGERTRLLTFARKVFQHHGQMHWLHKTCTLLVSVEEIFVWFFDSSDERRTPLPGVDTSELRTSHWRKLNNVRCEKKQSDRVLFKAKHLPKQTSLSVSPQLQLVMLKTKEYVRNAGVLIY